MYILHLMLESEESNMPKVGDKEFAYTPEGIAAAKVEAEASGEAMEIVDAASRTESYELGGKIPGQPGFGVRPPSPIQPLPTPDYDRGPFDPNPPDPLGGPTDFIKPPPRPALMKKGGKVKKK